MAYYDDARPRTWVTRVKELVIVALVAACVYGASRGYITYTAGTIAHQQAALAFTALYQPARDAKGNALQAKDADGHIVPVRVIDVLLLRVQQDATALATSSPPPK